MNFYCQPVSSLYKIRSISDIPSEPLHAQTLLQGEHFAFQLAMYSDTNTVCRIRTQILNTCGIPETSVSKKLQLFRIQNVIMDYPIYTDHDEDILSDCPGIMPDLLDPSGDTDCLIRMNTEPVCVLLSLDTPGDLCPGKYTLNIFLQTFDTLTPHLKEDSCVSLELTVLNQVLPTQSVHFTQWFHVDCIAEAYQVPVYSEQHWELIDRFMAAARYLGIDTILTPILTPPLDTMIGMERPKVQLVRIEKNGGLYRFDFKPADRFIRLARKNGIEHFEISHLYSQWGLRSAPNIYAVEDGTEKRIFGWETDAHGNEYRSFLAQFLPALTAFLKKAGVYEHCFFHLSDEPHKEHLPYYLKAHSTVKPFIPDRPVMDALSDPDFYKEGLIDIPVTATNHIEPFLQEEIAQQWVYYCCGQYKKVGNRFLTFPAYRNRILGIQIFKFGIKGFLQWGFNFYHAERSAYYTDPYITTSADRTFPSGDPFSVYPGKDGPLLTLRALIFKDALQDVEILNALEKKTSHRYVVDLIEKYAGAPVSFEEYPRNYEYIPQVIDAVKQKLSEFL